MNSSLIFIIIQPFAIIIKTICEKHNYNKVLIYYLFFTSTILLYYSYYEHQYQNNNDLEDLINYFLCCIYCWISMCLLFGDVFKISGMIYPLLIGFVFIFVFFKYLPVSTLKMSSDIYFHSDLELFNQLRLLINAVIEQTIRENNLNLLSYFFTYIKNNFEKNEVERLYGMSSEEIRFFFFQYIENTFRTYNQVFKESICLRIMNAFFLMKCLGQYSKAYMIFYTLLEIDNIYLTYSQEFFIFRQKKNLENKIFENGIDPSNISTYFQINTFIKLISKACNLYINFWQFLLQTNEKEENDKLYELGFDICENREEIDFIFNNLVKSRVKDKKIFLLYGYYLKEILNDYEGALDYLKNSDIENYQEILNIGNVLDLTKINSSADFQYIIISGKKDNFGVIEKISLGLCNIIGYSHEKICGENINIFLPNFLHDVHNNVLKKTVKNYFKNYNLKLGKNTENDFYYHFVIFLKTSSKFLYPIPFNIGVIFDENYDCAIYAKVDFFSSFDSNDYLNNTCHIITDSNLIVQESTSNSVIFFENNNFAGKSLDITSIINEFYPELYNEMTLNPSLRKLFIQKLILKKKYMTNAPIKVVTVGNKKFRMNCSELILEEKIWGYHFNFELFNENDNNRNFDYSVISNGFATPRKRKVSQTQISVLNKEFSFVNGDYIPEGKQFFFNFEKKTFFPKKKNELFTNITDQNNNISNYVKTHFIKKINSNKKVVTIKGDSSLTESYVSSDYENDSSEQDSDSEFEEELSEFSSKNEKSEKKEKIKSNNKVNFCFNEDKNNIEDDIKNFYKIKIQKISFLMYDFEKNRCVIINLPHYKSKIEEILYNEKNKKKFSSELPKKKKTKIYSLAELKQLMLKNKKDFNENLQIQDIINEKIKPKTINKSILINCLVIILTYLIILIMGLIFGIETYYEHENLNLMSKMILIFTSVSVDAYKILLSTTELFLLTNDKINGFNLDKKNHSEMIINELSDIFNSSFEKIHFLRNSKVKLTDENSEFLKNFKIKIYSISDRFLINQTSIRVIYLNNEFLFNLYKIIFIPFEKRIFTNKYYNFIFFNTDNGFSVGAKNYSEIYLNDFNNSKKELKMINILYLTMFGLIEVVCCCFQLYSFLFMLNEKENHMKYFFLMTDEQISLCQKKCNNFSKISQNNLNEPSNLLKNPNIVFESNLNENESSHLLSENLEFFQIKERIEEKKKPTNFKKAKTKLKFRLKKEQIYYIIIVIILIGLLIFISYYSDFVYSHEYHYLLIHYSIFEHELFFFQRFSYIKMFLIYNYYINSHSHLNRRYNILLEFIHNGYTENSQYLNNMHHLIKKYGLPKETQIKMNNVSFSNICSYYSYLENILNRSCLNFSDGILLKGFEPLSNYFIDSFIYYFKEISKAFEFGQKKNYIYNEFLYGTEEYNINLPKDEKTLKDYQENNPININNEEKMKDLYLLIKIILIPLVDDISNSISNELLNIFKKVNNLIIGINISFIVVIVGFILIFLLPILITKNNEINKVRKMLGIIPKDIIINFFIKDDKNDNR